jgi:hypothetical protein
MISDALATVTAHEFGHFLLQQGHPQVDAGIMKQGMEIGDELFQINFGDLEFTPGQAEKIRTRCKQIRKGGGGSGGNNNPLTFTFSDWGGTDCGQEGCGGMGWLFSPVTGITVVIRHPK